MGAKGIEPKTMTRENVISEACAPNTRESRSCRFAPSENVRKRLFCNLSAQPVFGTFVPCPGHLDQFTVQER